MQSERFFQTTRGRIVAALRRRHAASAFDLASEIGLSPNAIRQQLVVLERDGIVTEKAVRRGPTKPTLEYSLTAAAEQYFPQHYDRLLSAVLNEVRETQGAGAVAQLFENMGRRSATKYRERLRGKGIAERAEAVRDILREKGVEAELETVDGGLVLHEHNCPYASTVKDHPEVCSVIHTVLNEAVAPDSRQTESLATGGSECRFEISVAK